MRRSRQRSLGVFVTVCAALALVSACGSSSSSTSSGAAKSAAKTPVTILSIGDTTGPTKLYGQISWDVTQGAAAYWNSHGGIDGHPVVAHHVSDNGDGATAVTVLIRQLSSSTPTMIDAGSEAGDIAALVPAIAKHNVLAFAKNDSLGECSTDATKTCPNEWMFINATSSNLVPLEAAGQWFAHKGIKKVGILEEQFDYAEGETPSIVKVLSSEGISHTIATFPMTAVDVTPEMQALRASRAQAVFTEALGPAAGYALTARANLGWNVPMVFDFAASGVDITKLAPATDDKNAYEVVDDPMEPSFPSKGIPLMLQYSKPYGNIAAVPLDVGASQWDELVVLDEAVKAAGGSLDVKALDNAILHLPPTNPLLTSERRIAFSASDHDSSGLQADDWEILPVGPVVGGQVQPPS